MESAWLDVSGAQDVAAVGEVGVGEAHLAEERRGEVALVGEDVDFAAILEGTAEEEHRYVRVEMVRRHRLGVAAVVAEDDDECVVPGVALLEARDEISECLVGVSERVGHFVVGDAAVGHDEGLVRRERLEHTHPSASFAGVLFDFFEYAVERHVVVDTPAAAGSVCGEVLFLDDALKTGLDVIFPFAEDGEVAAVDEEGVVSEVAEALGEFGEAGQSRRHADDAVGGEGGVAAERRHETALGAESVGLDPRQ